MSGTKTQVISAKRIALITVISVTTAAVLAGIALAVYFTWPKEVTLIGSFTILEKTVSEVSDSSICSYLTEILSASELNAINCSILDKKSETVNVRYKLIIEDSNVKDGDKLLNLASSAIAESSSDNSIFTIDQNSITFEIESEVVQRFCDSTPCVEANVVCISVVGGYHCSCSTGYSRVNGICSRVQIYCNETRTWIPKQQICDKFQDCPDDSDEINCACDSTYQYHCRNGRCIYKKWLCDGVHDCPQGDDEIPPQCAECTSSEFRCEKPRKCISWKMRCDGRSDCVDSSDESRCVDLDGIGSTNETRVLTAIYNGISGYRICSNDWNATWNNWLCSVMGLESAVVSYSSVPLSGPFLTLTAGNSSSNLMTSFNPGTCSSQQAVAIGCKPAGCGSRSVDTASIGPYILNGQRAARGAWPWQVVVYTGYFSDGQFTPVFLCGGILIDRRWILTAAHCTQIDEYNSKIGYTGKTRPGSIEIVLGTISLEDNPDTIRAYADQVHTHPQYDGNLINNDVGLIRLSKPVSISDTVRPICLPAPDQDLSRFKVCVNTGFGWTLRSTASQNLLQAKMNIIPDSECIRANRNYNSRTQICIGTIPTIGDINICSGDSGGPLSCQDPNGVWTVIGVNSYGVGSIHSNTEAVDRCQLSVVARVTAFVDWISTTMSTHAL